MEWASAPDADALANAAGGALDHRVTLIDSTGRVIGDSEFDGPALALLENHATRPEVAAARRGDTGISRRSSVSRGDDEIYVAVPGPGGGVARVSMSTEQLAGMVRRARNDVLLSGAIALGRGIAVHGFMMPSAVGGLGLGIMGGALTLPHNGGEAIYTVLGVATLALGHRLNFMAAE